MPTLRGLRRRGYTPESIRNFIERVGVAKVPSTVEVALLEHCLREDLNENATRAMAVLHPVKLTLTNYPEGKSETFEMENHPYYPERGTHTVSFSREVWVERDDFMEEPVKGYFRLFPGNEVRLKSAYVVRCTGCVKDEKGNVTEILATYDPDTRGGNTPDGRKVKGTIHWVDAATAKTAQVRLYSSLFMDPEPESGDGDFLDCMNGDSLETLTDCKIEAGILPAHAPASFQFLRLGYFCIDNTDSTPEHPVFNRSVSLKDSFNKK
jgi:glutaminyl-tRNA synthetase